MNYIVKNNYGSKTMEKLKLFHSFREVLETEGLEVFNINDSYFFIKNKDLNLYIQDRIGTNTYTVNIDFYDKNDKLNSTVRIAEVSDLTELKEIIYNEIKKSNEKYLLQA